MAEKKIKEIEINAEQTKAKGERVRNIDIKLRAGAFTSFFRRFTEAGREYGQLNFGDIATLRQLLSNEKARILYTLQSRKPSSIYELAKIVGRNFKSVRKDIELLRHFGFIRFISEAKGRRKRLRPVLNLDKLQITISLR